MAIVSYHLPKEISIAFIYNEARKGINARLIDELVTPLGFTRSDAAMMLGINLKTLSKYVSVGQTLEPADGEIALKAAKLGQRGLEVFGNAEEFQAWLSEPAFGLYNKIPKEMLNTSAGFDLVQNELDNIAFGDLA